MENEKESSCSREEPHWAMLAAKVGVSLRAQALPRTLPGKGV